MIASGKQEGKVARGVLLALAGLLVIGIGSSLWMGVRARSAATNQAVEQARTIADRSLTLVFDPPDLNQPVDATRATTLTQQVTSVVLDPSDFTGVTLYSSDGLILYSSEVGRIGNEMSGETDRIHEALRNVPQTRSYSGTFSVMLPFRFPSGVGRAAAVELTRPDGPIASAASPWRTNAFFLFALLVLLGVAVYGVTRITAATQMAVAMQQAARSGDGRPQPSPVAATAHPRPIEVPMPGLREEGDARRKAEDRARAAEERLVVLQDQYRKTLEELQQFQRVAREPALPTDAKLEERALRAEGQLHTLQQQLQLVTGERERLAKELLETNRLAVGTSGGASAARLADAEQETIGLRAELEGAHAQLAVVRRELEDLRTASGATPDLQHNLDATHVELLHAKDALASAQTELGGAKRELDDVRQELRALRNEEQRAAMLEDELRGTKAELESATASHRAELVEREAEFEEKVRATREEFQRQLSEIDASYQGQLGQREASLASRIAEAEASARGAARELELVKAELATTRAETEDRERRLVQASDELAGRRAEIEALRTQMGEREGTVQTAATELEVARGTVDSLQAEVHTAHEAVAQLREELASERVRATEASDVAGSADRERRALGERIEKLAHQLESAVAENAELNRRLQDAEARRQLELADDQGRAQLDDLLRVTQERLAGQTEKLIAAEDRVKDLETDLATRIERIEIVEADLRAHQMSEALKEKRRTEHDVAEAASPAAEAGEPIEDRRAATPFTKELSLDAKKTLSRMMGITQILKHKRDAKDQAQLIKQLTSYARRLDHTVSDLADADRLARGNVELQIKRSDVEALLRRVVEESGIANDHEVRVEADTFVIGVDALRTEQILSGLLRGSGDRTPNGKQISVRLQQYDGGVLFSVEDPEPSSDASVSPVVKRFAEMQGGWAKVESRDGGGSAFRVYLPDAAPLDEAASDLRILVDAQQADVWDNTAEQILVQELHRLAELPED